MCGSSVTGVFAKRSRAEASAAWSMDSLASSLGEGVRPEMARMRAR